MDYEQRMRAAIALLESQEAPNYSAIAREFDLNRQALTNRLLGKTTSRSEAPLQKPSTPYQRTRRRVNYTN